MNYLTDIVNIIEKLDALERKLKREVQDSASTAADYSDKNTALMKLNGVILEAHSIRRLITGGDRGHAASGPYRAGEHFAGKCGQSAWKDTGARRRSTDSEADD